MKTYKTDTLINTLLQMALGAFIFWVPPGLAYWYFYRYLAENGATSLMLWSGIAVLPVAGAGWMVYCVYRHSYTIAAGNERLVETQLFRQERSLSVFEVTNITLSYYSYYQTLLTDVPMTPIILSPRFVNNRYKKFPRYGFLAKESYEIVGFVRANNAAVPVDGPAAQYLEGNMSPHMNSIMRKQMWLINIVAAVLLILVLLMFGIL